MKQKILIIFLVFSLLFPSPFLAKTAQAETPPSELIERIRFIHEAISRIRTLLAEISLQQAISAESYLAINLSDNSTILKRNTETIHSIASITKLMSTVIAVENIDLDKETILREEMLRPYGYSPSLFIGARVTARDLLIVSLTQSTNDAAHSLTFFMEEGEFLKLMNEKAQEIGMSNTEFYDAHGLNPLNRSTSADIIKLLQYVYNNHPQLLEITKENDFWLPDPTGRLLKFKNVNNFHEESWLIGGKTGYLPEAKQTFAAILDVNGETIALSLLYSANRQEDTLEIINRIKKALRR